MRYLITGYFEPLPTDHFSVENNYIKGMVIYDLHKREYYDGSWKELKEDNL